MDIYKTLNADAKAFLARRSFDLMIDGEKVPPNSGRHFETVDPSTGEVLAEIAEGDASDIDRAVRAARSAFEGPWSKWTPYERQALLFRIHDKIESHFDELAQIESIDMGAPLSRTQGSKIGILRMIAFFASLAMNIRGETLQNGLPGDVTTMSLKAPVGVIGGIIPWNGPLGGLWWSVGAALATGCTAVLKPAEDASLSVLRVVELLHEAGVPGGVVNVVTGYGSVAGEALARHPGVDRIAFTGSTVTGRKIIEASTVNIKRLQLELGGKSPDIVFADADLDKAVPGVAIGGVANSGQVCYAGTRVLVQRSIAKDFAARLGAYMDTLRVGRSLDPDVQLGPIVSGKQLNRVISYIDIGTKEGARLVSGGKKVEGALAGGYFVRPTVFADVHNDMTIAREEIFGPVLSIIPFDTVEEAITIGNQTEYGLGGAVWSTNISTALKVVKCIHAGVMWVNCYGIIDPLVGFGGTKMSGYGAKGSTAHLDNYLYTKTVYIQS
ncbi:MAG: aldehyde dehydrogenase [Mesorhizobium sp.]|nr:MAG: aldehyde dehydrogenase [Mesorhizobium sp.]